MSSDNTNIVGASIIIFAIDTQFGIPHFLLGRERHVRGWQGSERWGDFGGSSNKNESPCKCAAREFEEETLSVVKWCANEPRFPRTSSFFIEKSLETGKYLFKLIYSLPNNKRYITFVKQVPWQPNINTLFQDVSSLLRSGNFKGFHPARPPGKTRLTSKYTEKTQLKWWSLLEIQKACASGNLCRFRREKLSVNFRKRIICLLKEFPWPYTATKNTKKYVFKKKERK